MVYKIRCILVYLAAVSVAFSADGATRLEGIRAQLEESIKTIREEQRKIGALLVSGGGEELDAITTLILRDLASRDDLPRSSVEDQYLAFLSLAISRGLINLEKLSPDAIKYIKEDMHPEVTAKDRLSESVYDRASEIPSPRLISLQDKHSEKLAAWQADFHKKWEIRAGAFAYLDWIDIQRPGQMRK